MKPSLAASVLIVCSGAWTLSAQGARTTTQYDYWNWYALKAPGPAEGIVTDPSSDNILFATAATGLYESNDSGVTWRQLSPNHIDKEAFVFDPVNANRVLAGMVTVLWLSTDHAGSWSQIG